MRIRAILRAVGAALTAAWWIAGAAATPAAQPKPAPPELWLAPAGIPAGALPPFAVAVASLTAGKPTAAAPVFAQMTKDPILGGYALLYLGRAQLADGKPSNALYSAQQLLSTTPTGRLKEAALWLTAEAAEAARDWPAEIRALQALIVLPGAEPELAWLNLGRTQVSSGDRQAAMQTFAKVYYEFGLTGAASSAAEEMAKLAAVPITPTRDSYALDLGRAQQLYGARRYTDARKSFDALRPLAQGDDRSLIALRLAECDFGLRRYVAARDGLKSYLDQSSTRLDEAQYLLSLQPARDRPERRLRRPGAGLRRTRCRSDAG